MRCVRRPRARPLSPARRTGRIASGPHRTRFARTIASIDCSRPMMTYAEARDALVKHLSHDADAHDAADYDSIGRRFDAIEYRFPRGTEPELGRLHIALAF